MRRVYLLMAIIGFLVCFAVAAIFIRMDFFGRLLADKVLANAAMPTEQEMPPTSGQIPFSSADIQIIGGRGEGLSCSLPKLLADLAFPREEGREAIGLQMRQACATHDYCYRHGAATYGYTQADCDFLLQEHAFRLCYFIERREPGTDMEAKQSKCIRDARLVTLGVRAGGSDSFRSLNPSVDALSEGLENKAGLDGRASTYFEFDPYPVRSLSYAVYRIADAPDAEGTLPGSKALYKFSMRPSGMFVSKATMGKGARLGALRLHVKLPGDPSYIVNAPVVVATTHKGKKEDWFVWWQRRGLSQTHGRILAIAARRATNEDWNCLYRAGMTEEMLGGKDPCATRNTIAIVEVGKADPDDGGFSQVVPAHGTQPAPDTLHLMALQTNSCDGSGAKASCFRDILISTALRRKHQPQEALRVADQLANEKPGQKQDEDGFYRNYVAAPLVFQSPLERDPLMTWARRDKDYETKAFLRRIGIARKTARPKNDTGRSRGSVWLADIQENDEPLFALGRTGERQSLVAIRKSDDTGVGRVEIRQWRLPGLRNDDTGEAPLIKANTDACRPKLEGTWLARPPIVVSVASDDAVVLLSRVVGAKEEDGGYGLALATLKIGTDGRCSESPFTGPKIPAVELIANVTDDDSGKSLQKLKQMRLELLRKTPILFDDLDGDSTFEVVFPGAGNTLNPNVMARVSKDGLFSPEQVVAESMVQQ
ncbi:hypothetical protein N181_26890 [Sinorhizobium fredii USDA 205]|uniref:Uncharacterized protein n=1 Tax=Rhizobium fredii TaxID=380 RepID=A0A844A9Q8_RHIFR|nr:hypothetical protein [Sinorhizobium fredii]AWM27126.1 hypothetical protein AOX55_00003902 [Sinorhizobium fredii CCBAU 25509]KSV82942.1 hypothetical protein N181_26890 [Sinorhizobium fredii USDA 205]MQW94649.1 hypothetical protein [Sinorhizobium fredii]MQX08828.1 hypothetical protein [Sinorhizobium fredii]UTY51138.1 hypothetical protein EPK84_32455 [Sinorhizobium fredii]